jgi:hypothetical protein
MCAGNQPYPQQGWYEIRTTAGTLHIPEAYATAITPRLITAIGIDPDCAFTITGQEGDETTHHLGDYRGTMRFILDPAMRIYHIEGVDGPRPCLEELGINGAFYKPLENPIHGPAPDKPRSRMDFANASHGRIYEYLCFDLAPVNFTENGATFNRKHTTYKRKLRDFKKNARKRFQIKDGHLLYNVNLRRRKKVTRDIHLKLHPTKIVPFNDEVQGVPLYPCHHNKHVRSLTLHTAISDSGRSPQRDARWNHPVGKSDILQVPNPRPTQTAPGTNSTHANTLHTYPLWTMLCTHIMRNLSASTACTHRRIAALVRWRGNHTRRHPSPSSHEPHWSL